MPSPSRSVSHWPESGTFGQCFGFFADSLSLALSHCVSFHYSKDECRNVMVGVREISPLAVARVLGMMARTPAGLGDQQQVCICVPACI